MPAPPHRPSEPSVFTGSFYNISASCSFKIKVLISCAGFYLCRRCLRLYVLMPLCVTRFIISNIGAVTAENAPSDMCAHRGLNPACAFSQSDQSLYCLHELCLLGYPKCAQWRFRSDCAIADLNLRWAHIYKGMFPYVAVHLISRNYWILNMYILQSIKWLPYFS